MSIVEGTVVKKWRKTANRKTRTIQLQSYFAGAKIYSVYEAGFSGFVLHRQLEKAGIENVVVNAASVEVTVNNRVKTDKRDALKLASLLEAKRLKGIRIPSEQQEQYRLLTRTRQQLIKEQTAVKNKIRMKCHQLELIEADELRRMSHKLVEKMLLKSPSSEFSLVIEAYWQVWKAIETEVKKLEKRLEEQAKEDLNKKIYRSAPGIGPIGARILSNELGIVRLTVLKVK